MCEKHYTGTVKNEERNSLKKQMGGQGDNNIKQNRQQKDGGVGGGGWGLVGVAERGRGRKKNHNT